MGDRHIRAADRIEERYRTSYLGDGAYVAFDGFGFWLTAEDGLQATDAVYLEQEVFDRLAQFVREMRA